MTTYSKVSFHALQLCGFYLMASLAASAQAPGELLIKGVVLDASTGLPLADVPVSLTETSTRKRHSFKTSLDGSFAFKVPHSVQFLLSAEETPQTLYASRNLRPETGALAFEAKLLVQRAGRVSGRVIGPDGKGAGGVRVQLRMRGFRDALPAFADQRNRVADEEGRFSFTGLNPGSYLMSAIPKPRERTVVVASASTDSIEYIPAITYYPSGATPLDASRIEVGYGQSIDHLELRMRKAKASCLAFSVESHEELVLPGNLSVAEQYIGSQSRVIDEPLRSLGPHRICGVPEGAYRFSLRLTTTNAEARYATQAIEAINGKDMEIGKVLLSPLGTFRGGVLVETSKEQSRETVEQLYKGLTVRQEPTDRLTRGDERVDLKPSADGSFEFKAIVEDSYRLRVEGLQQGVYVKAMSSGPIDLLMNAVTDPAHKIRVNVATDGPIVTGVVRGQYEAAKSGCLVSIVDASASTFTRSNFATTRSTSDGLYTLSSIAPGQYKLSGTCDFVPYSKVSDPDRLRDVQRNGTPIQVSASQTATLNIVVK
jgi:hypothetical protein